MSKQKANSQKRRRDRKYTGEDASVTQKKVTRVSVPDRSNAGQWWHENRKKIGFRALALFVVLLLFAATWSLISWIF